MDPLGRPCLKMLKLTVSLGAGLQDPLSLLLQHLHESLGPIFSAPAQLTLGALCPFGGEGFPSVLELGQSCLRLETPGEAVINRQSW